MKTIHRTWKVCRKSKLEVIKSRVIEGVEKVFILPEGCRLLSHEIFKDPEIYDDWYAFLVVFSAPDSYKCIYDEYGIQETTL